MLEAGIATPKDVDEALKLRLNYAVRRAAEVAKAGAAL
jgi:hypothetical protein